MKKETLQKIELLVSDSFREIADHAFQDEVNSQHVKKIKNNLSEILAVCQKDIDEVSSVIAHRTRLEESDKFNILKIAYAMSRFDYHILNKILGTRYNQSESFNYLEKLTKVKATTLKNIRDRFDPYVKQERSERVGWHQVQLTPDYQDIKNIYDKKDESFISHEMKEILGEYRKMS
jgi:DNA-directed RNA polymerase subunit F